MEGQAFVEHHLARQTTFFRSSRTLGLFLLVILLALPAVTREWWIPALGWGLVCDSHDETPDLIVIDNLDSDYLLFEKAAELRERGFAGKVLVPVQASGRNPAKPNLVSREIVDVMVRVAGLEGVNIIPIQQEEPITLNAARQVRGHLEGTNVKTVLVLTSGFKSKRILLVFKKVLSEDGIDVYCLPVWGGHRPENWAQSWHGIQEVFLQLIKLGYYRLWVL